MAATLVDTGFLVALYVRRDRLHGSALDYLRHNQQTLATVSPVVVEACFFLDAKGKGALLEWLVLGGVHVFDVPVAVYGHLVATINKNAEHNVDFTDAALVWLANETGERRVLTVDKTDFSLFQLRHNSHFEIIEWY